MRTKTLATIAVTLLATLGPSSSVAGPLNGSVKVGGVILDEEGDLSAVQETYNVHDGFSIAQIRLNGNLNQRSYLMLDLRDVNLDSRQGDLVYRVPGTFRLSAGYDQNRQVFDPARSANSERKDWRLGAQFTPQKWLNLSGSFNYLTRDGDRLAFPSGTSSVLGSRYDNVLKIGQVTAEARKGKRGGAVSFRISDYTDDQNGDADRRGQIVSARAYTPCFFYDKLTHLIRGAYGKRKLSNGDLDYTLASFQYTGVLEPVEEFQVKYNFDANRIDNDATRLKTDRFQNNLDATYFHQYGRITAGYGYEINDDDRTLTRYHSWRAGATYHSGRWVSAKVDYAGRIKKDQEELTLLKDVEASRIRGRLELRPVDRLMIGGGYTKRDRELPDIGVEIEGDVVNAFGRYDHMGWGSLSGDYSYSDDEYDDLAGGFDTRSHIATGRVEFSRIKNLRLAGGFTYMDIRKDLDIEKSSVFVEGAYQVLRDYRLEVQYNVYNYDDYILIDRYYTANVVRFNLAYDLHL